MANKKIIAIVGATGTQGGGLVRAIMSDVNSDFTARALTWKDGCWDTVGFKFLD